MRSFLASVMTLAVAGSAGAFGQDITGTVESNQLAARSATFYVNTSATINNASTESLGVAITASGDVVIGWEDDADNEAELNYLGAVWTLYSSGGVAVTPDATITSNLGGEITSKFLSYFRADKSPIPGNTAWGPKIKANPFGDGFGMGATVYALGGEVPAWADWDAGGDWPGVQLLSSGSEPLGIVSGVPADYGAVSGNIRIGDWDYLSNGNIVVVGESNQGDDLVNKYGGAAAGKHVIYRLVTPAGQEVKAVSLVSEVPSVAEMWHGAAVTANGFAIRFGLGGRGTVRLFDNAGNPTSANIDLGTLAANELAAQGGRGDGIGFHGNGKDAYVCATTGTDGEGARQVWVTVLNADGTLRYSKAATPGVPLSNVGRVDAAIDESGRVFVVFGGQTAGDNPNFPLIIGALLKPDGSPVDQPFFVSEKEGPLEAFYESRNPRIAVRQDAFAVVWESQNSETDFGTRVVAGRTFGIAHKPGSIESVGLTRIVPDTPVINPGADALGNWEPYASVLGTSTFLIEGNTFADDGTMVNQRYVVMLQPAAGGTPKMVEGFYADNGQPFKGQINASRQNGNPGRVAGDTRPGAVNYMVGGEASPHVYTEFQSDNRWNLGMDRLIDGRYGTIQAFSLDVGTLTPTPLFKAIDSSNARATSGVPPGNQITRFGADIVALDNGNFASVVEDRSRVLVADSDYVAATIYAPDGTVVKETFVVANGDIWSNVAACQGGFVVRAKPQDGSAGRVLYFYDNAGVLKGQAHQDTSGSNFDTGRGDGTRLAGHVNSPYVYLAGKVTDGNVVKVAAWDCRNQQFVAAAEVSEAGFAGNFDRANLAVDALNRITVSWVSQPPGYEQNQVAARVLVLDPDAKTITPLTSSFLPFVNAAETGGIRTIQMSIAMTTKQILVAAKGEINLANQPANGVDSPRELNFYTVISHPDPKDDPTPPVGGAPAFTRIAKNANGTLTVEWTGGGTLQSAPAVTGAWTDVAGATSPHTLTPSQAQGFHRIRR